jgi:methionine synthase II (cobalamin-independent)
MRKKLAVKRGEKKTDRVSPKPTRTESEAIATSQATVDPSELNRLVTLKHENPHMLAKVAHDEHYGDISKMMQDLAKVMNTNFKKLEAEGCKYIQIDEPLFAISDDNEVQAAVDAINMSTEGLQKMSVQTHICQGNYAVGADYDGQIGHRYFDTGRYPAALICKINCDVLVIEGDLAPQYEGLLAWPVPLFVAVTVAPGTVFSVESTTRPTMSPVVP